MGLVIIFSVGQSMHFHVGYHFNISLHVGHDLSGETVCASSESSPIERIIATVPNEIN